jgi:DNA-binding transcriptional regulator YdaS (Cro superfamily)
MTKQQAVKHYGSEFRLADALGISRQAVNQWTVIPLGQQARIELDTGGKLKADRKKKGAKP